MLDNAPFHRLRHGNLTIEGWSRAGIQSYWHIPELGIGFDFGAIPWDFKHTGIWFLSHPHLDHITAMPAFIARRAMMKLGKPTIHVPGECRTDIIRYLKSVQRLDKGKQSCRLKGMLPGDEVELSSLYHVRAIEAFHTVPARGYIVEERRQKLKAEYSTLKGEEIRELRQSGVAVTETLRIPILAYTGDTTAEIFEKNPELYQVRILITEMSFLEDWQSVEKIHSHGHMHLQDFLDRANLFHNELLIASHVSSRSEQSRVDEILDAKLPPRLKSIFKVWM